jgi:hypothetical protein
MFPLHQAWISNIFSPTQNISKLVGCFYPLLAFQISNYNTKLPWNYSTKHSEYRWLNCPIRIIHGHISKIIDLSVTDVSGTPTLEAPCLWVFVHPDLPNTITQPFLRNLFSREITYRPLGRSLIFLPYSFQSKAKLVIKWNTLIQIQRLYYNQAKQGCYKNLPNIDPYAMYVHCDGRSESARKWALSMQDFQHIQLYASFDRRPTTPWIKGALVTKVSQFGAKLGLLSPLQ